MYKYIKEGNMKNFIEKSKSIMKNLKIMIVLVVLALFFTALYIGVLARPISYGMAYSGVIEGNESSINFVSGDIMEMTAASGGSSVTMQMWYISNGNKVMPMDVVDEDGTLGGMTREEFETAVEQLKADTELWNQLWEGDQSASINAFSMYSAGEQLTCNGAIAFAVVMGVITVVAIVMAGLSVSLYVKDRKTGGEVKTDEHPDKDMEQGAN